MDWRRYFKAHILERGLNYYTQDRVSSFEVSSNHISARVTGTGDYLIEAQLEAEQLIALSCDCPYAAENNFCKHMAAVMYAYENQYDSSINSQAYKSVEDYVLNADENSVRLFLTEILKKDNDLFKQFMVSLGEPITKVDMDRYSNKLRSILSDYLYPDDFIDYEKSWDFSSDLSHYMTKIIEKLLLENGYYEEAFKLTKQVFIELINLPIDDSGGIIMDLAAECSELWKVILDQCAINLKEEMFSWFHSLIENQSLDYLNEIIEEILWSKFQEKEFLEKNQLLSKSRFDYYKNESQFSSKYNAEKWAIYYLKTLNEPKDIKAFCEDNLNYIEVREYYVDRLIEERKYPKAISLLEELKKTEHTLTPEYREKLMELYTETKNKTCFNEELHHLVILFGSRRMDLYDRYKAQFKEEAWLKNRGLLLDKISLWNGKDMLLLQEEMYDELLEIAIQTRGLEVIRKHKKLLYELDATRVSDKYEDEILKACEETSSRKKYREISYTIGELKQLTNNHKRVDDIVLYLRETYKRRPAMMEELSHL